MANITDAEIAEMKAVCKSLSLGATWEFACETRYFLPRLLDAYERRTEELSVANQIGDTFWEALKPLNLPAINIANPGSHVTALIREREAWKHAAEQASGMNMAENILAERDVMKMQLRETEQERDRLAVLVRKAEDSGMVIAALEGENTELREERDALAAAMSSEKADLALAYASVCAELDTLRAQLKEADKPDMDIEMRGVKES